MRLIPCSCLSSTQGEGETPIGQDVHQVKLLPQEFVSDLPVELVVEMGVVVETEFIQGSRHWSERLHTVLARALRTRHPAAVHKGN